MRIYEFHIIIVADTLTRNTTCHVRIIDHSIAYSPGKANVDPTSKHVTNSLAFSSCVGLPITACTYNELHNGWLSHDYLSSISQLSSLAIFYFLKFLLVGHLLLLIG